MGAFFSQSKSLDLALGAADTVAGIALSLAMADARTGSTLAVWRRGRGPAGAGHLLATAAMDLPEDGTAPHRITLQFPPVASQPKSARVALAAAVLPAPMDQRNAPYGIPAGRGGLPGGMPQQQQQQQQQQRAPQQPGMQQHYGMQDMMFDPLPMTNGMFHQPPAVGGHMMHQQHPGSRAGGMQGLGGLMQQQGMVAPEDDLDDLMSALGDPVGMNGQQQQQGLGQMPSHVYDQSHLVQPRSQAPNLQPGRTQGLPLPSQAAPMQQGMPGSMHMNQMAPNGARMGVGLQQPGMGAPAVSSSIGGIGGLGVSIPAPAAPRQTAVVPSAIVPSSTKSSTSSRALTTSSNNGGSSDEDGNMGEDDAQKKKERRRQQVRYASRRRRKKQKDEESFLRDRIAELKEQIRIIGGDLTEQCSQMAGMSEQALTEATSLA
ncbi:unnamed protein product [Phytophthora lilii]|uniref:Unnamed protein product n=1 Tax=Phytophthora lilii TaxID=2077276 RepID=A0A9W6X5L1_9STRA|nr:unnamed protein product [Phytophthora lilii]